MSVDMNYEIVLFEDHTVHTKITITISLDSDFRIKSATFVAGYSKF